MDHDFKKLEQKWQKKWNEKKIFSVKENLKKKKFYVLEMFPYPSASGLHMGHALNYSIGDIYSRFKRMQGFNVMYPMGFDSFGLPAENAAINAKSHPKKFTEDAIKNYIKQMREIGLSYDWERLIETHKPEYYKWDQWIFLKMYEKGLAYKKKSSVNWCSKCNTVLANEQVVDGKCWRHDDNKVEIKYLDQWFFKITKYADELYEGLEKMDFWPERIKTMQKNWIGKSSGVEIDFEINGKIWKVFTTRPDTIHGVTFMVVSAQHPNLTEIVASKEKSSVDKFLKKLKSVSEKELENTQKEGVFSGSYAINPINDEKIPVYIGNFVVADYGSGMVMAVPGHDKRDFEFAKKYKLKIKEVYDKKGNLINSGAFNGLELDEAKIHILKALEFKKKGRKVVNFKIRDWLISRQRFWGTPIPIIYCDKCGIVPVSEKDLPIELPDDVKFSGTENPLKSSKKFLNVKCPKCKSSARRETDTMDTFVNSSWYFLRYCDPKNNKEIFSKNKVKYWEPIDQYIGGVEHATGHLIYFRFYTKFLRDLGLLNFNEPAIRLFNQGMLHGLDGEKMSKSKGNVILPEEVSKKYGMDAARLFLVSVATPDKDIDWSENGVEGSFRFVNKVMDYFEKVKVGKSEPKIESKLNKTIKLVTNHIENFKYNLAAIEIRELFNSLPEVTSKDILEKFLKLLSPICPHITEELYEGLGNKNFISITDWPKVDEKKIDQSYEKQEALIEGVVNDVNNVKKFVEDADKVFLYSIPNELKVYVDNLEEIEKRTNLKVCVYAVNDKNKHDPQNKSKKAKPEKPGIYLE